LRNLDKVGLGFVNANDFGHGINLLVRLSLP